MSRDAHCDDSCHYCAVKSIFNLRRRVICLKIFYWIYKSNVKNITWFTLKFSHWMFWLQIIYVIMCLSFFVCMWSVQHICYFSFILIFLLFFISILRTRTFSRVSRPSRRVLFGRISKTWRLKRLTNSKLSLGRASWTQRYRWTRGSSLADRLSSLAPCYPISQCRCNFKSTRPNFHMWPEVNKTIRESRWPSALNPWGLCTIFWTWRFLPPSEKLDGIERKGQRMSDMWVGYCESVGKLTRKEHRVFYDSGQVCLCAQSVNHVIVLLGMPYSPYLTSHALHDYIWTLSFFPDFHFLWPLTAPFEVLL